MDMIIYFLCVGEEKVGGLVEMEGQHACLTLLPSLLVFFLEKIAEVDRRRVARPTPLSAYTMGIQSDTYI